MFKLRAISHSSVKKNLRKAAIGNCFFRWLDLIPTNHHPRQWLTLKQIRNKNMLLCNGLVLRQNTRHGTTTWKCIKLKMYSRSSCCRAASNQQVAVCPNTKATQKTTGTYFCQKIFPSCLFDNNMSKCKTSRRTAQMLRQNPHRSENSLVCCWGVATLTDLDLCNAVLLHVCLVSVDVLFVIRLQ